jgi:hypothetical protein
VREVEAAREHGVEDQERHRHAPPLVQGIARRQRTTAPRRLEFRRSVAATRVLTPYA